MEKSLIKNLLKFTEPADAISVDELKCEDHALERILVVVLDTALSFALHVECEEILQILCTKFEDL